LEGLVLFSLEFLVFSLFFIFLLYDKLQLGFVCNPFFLDCPVSTSMKELKQEVGTMKEDVETANNKLDQLTEKVSAQHVENVNADNLLMSELRSLRESIV